MNKNHPEHVPALPHSIYNKLMTAAFAQAQQAAAHDDIPVGALIIDPDCSIISTGHNHSQRDNDPSLHAEIVAIREACRALKTTHLNEYTLMSTLEPCAMCAGAVVNAHLRRVVFSAWDPKAGAAGSVLNILRNRLLPHQAEVIGGIREEQSAALLKQFFAAKRNKNMPPIC